MVSVGIIGATGYAGAELVRILINHPEVEIAAMSSVTYEGKSLAEIFPNFEGITDEILTDMDTVVERSDVVFASLPHGLSEPIARKCYDKGALFIDLGADFRLYDEEDYKKWYKLEYKDPELHKEAVYSLCELCREKTKNTKVIGNPGCYPTSISLGLYPLLKAGVVRTNSVIIDSKSGVTGAGRGLTLGTHYPECNEAISAYKVAAHRHTPEIEQMLSEIAGEKVTITFVPHLLPVNRGILSTIYVDLTKDISAAEIRKLYTDAYANEKFVRVLPEGSFANIRNVRCSNYCDISIHPDPRTGRVIITSAIDNMVKGAAGQAIQNMNIALGFAEDCGLNMVPNIF
ncbi:MAG: N-acetyl-gamma-glutamyl-phosphate reductase [Oscillospiraceae bacterium]|nr:N-acetyl-gamma-glutamyl-phosphate reductase [Oscillospiraceae bacterium]MBQ9939477.1 N-acetyl-gamma-glutamyl-phosphate reductase [Oscillospiraceae bacterium]